MLFDDFLSKHYPTNINEVVLATKSSRRQLTAIAHSGFLSPILLHGEPNIGKLTIATALIRYNHYPHLCNEESITDYDSLDTFEMPKETANRIRAIRDKYHNDNSGDNGKASIIVMGLDTFKADTQMRVISGVESSIHKNSLRQYILLAENINRVHPDLINQCIVVHLHRPSDESWVKRINHILITEGFNPLPESKVIFSIRSLVGYPKRILEKIYNLCEAHR